jgi:hypothetical protein
VPGDPRQDPRPELVLIVKGEDEIRPTGAAENSMGAGLSLDLPTDSEKGG